VSARSQLKRRLGQALAVASVTALVGAAAWQFQLGDSLSYDLPFTFFRQPISPTNLVLIVMDEASYRHHNQVWGKEWDRGLHARLLDRLREDQSGWVILDISFADPGPGDPEKDARLAKAMSDHGRVIIGADLTDIAQPGMKGKQVHPPREPFRSAAAKWGITYVGLDRRDDVLRQHYPGTETDPSIAWVAAAKLGAPITTNQDARLAQRWVRYYGTSNVLALLSYHAAFDRAPGYFKDKTVIVGGKPPTRYLGEQIEQFRTPYTLATGESMSGVELQATMLLNLLRGDWLTRPAPLPELCTILLMSFLAGFGLRLLKPVPGAAAAAAGAIVVAGAGILSARHLGVWFPWAALSGIAVPVAWLCALATYKQEERRPLSETYGEPAPFTTPNGEQPDVHIPDYALLKCIGRGAYGEVWLARNRVGLYHAIKIVFRKRFSEITPYEREFRGIRKYMPVSLKHAGLVRILYVGRNDQAGYFYYIMELGDDENTGPEINPETYAPRNFAKDLQKRERLPAGECVAMGIALSEPLEFLHKRGLMHRDIKPANIIFIDGVPKLADIGLVAEFSRTGGTDASYIGTEGYMAPEGPSKPTSDIYSFGKVLYEAWTGLDRRQFPTLPDWMMNQAELVDLMALNSLVLKCCDDNPRKRFQTAGDLRRALLELERRMMAKQPA
jgi:CHASE2 domain-containing sensor protein